MEPETNRGRTGAARSWPARRGAQLVPVGLEGQRRRSRRSPRRLAAARRTCFPVGGWRIYTISGSMPIFDPSGVAARGRRARRKPRSFTYDELLALPRVAPGLDVPLRHRLDGARTCAGRACASSTCSTLVEPLPQAKAIRFVSLEQPYNDSLTLHQAQLPDVMLALEMDGEPLSRPHGAPARVVIPEMYGYKGVKWLTRIEFVADQPTGLLGGPRLRPGRLGRALEWLLSAAPRRASRRTERAVHWVHATAFFVLLALGPLPLPAEPRRAASAGGRC